MFLGTSVCLATSIEHPRLPALLRVKPFATVSQEPVAGCITNRPCPDGRVVLPHLSFQPHHPFPLLFLTLGCSLGMLAIPCSLRASKLQELQCLENHTLVGAPSRL